MIPSMTQNAVISPSPGTCTFIPKMLASRVSGSRMTVTTVSSWSRYCCLCEMNASFVDSRLALAPMAVLPEFQHLGVGSELVRRGLDVCRERGHAVVVVVGHPRFYPRFGFSPALAARLASPFSGKESFMAAELVPDALDGVTGRVEYPPPFGQWV